MSHKSLLFDQASSKIHRTTKVLSPHGELELTFDEWIQASHWLLTLIQKYLPWEYNNWYIHYSGILNNNTWAKCWSLWLAYDSKIYCRSVEEVHQLYIWNKLKPSFIANTVREEMSRFSNLCISANPYTNHFWTQANPFQNQSANNSYFFL